MLFLLSSYFEQGVKSSKFRLVTILTYDDFQFIRVRDVGRVLLQLGDPHLRSIVVLYSTMSYLGFLNASACMY